MTCTTATVTVMTSINKIFLHAVSDQYPILFTKYYYFHAVPPLITEISAVDLYDNGTALNVSQKFIFDRENGGSMRIEVEEHKDYKQSTLIFNDTSVIFFYFIVVYYH